jgi:hypothetical protein
MFIQQQQLTQRFSFLFFYHKHGKGVGGVRVYAENSGLFVIMQ